MNIVQHFKLHDSKQPHISNNKIHIVMYPIKSNLNDEKETAIEKLH